MTMTSLVERFLTALTPALRAVGLTTDQVSRAFEELKLGGAQLAIELTQAEVRGVRLAQAVRDAEAYPRLVQAHNSVLDILSAELPFDIESLFKRLIDSPGLPPIDQLQRDLGRVAASKNGMQAALARFLLFEMVRIAVLVSTWSEAPDLYRVGVDDDVWDYRAEENLEVLLAHPGDMEGPDGIRPLEVVLTATLQDLLRYAEEASRAIARISHELDRQYESRAVVEKALRDAPAHEAVLIRNVFGVAWGHQRLEVPRLASQHPLLFEGIQRNTIDQLVSRRKRAMKERGFEAVPARTRPALIDLFCGRLKEDRA